MVKKPPANAGDAGDMGLIPESEDLMEEGVATPASKYPRLETPMDRGTWWAIVYGVAKSWTRLSMNTHTHAYIKRSKKE